MLSRDIERKEHSMDTFETMEYDYEETWGPETDSASQFGVALAAVVAGNLICWGAKKAYESIRKMIEEKVDENDIEEVMEEKECMEQFAET